MSSMAERNSVGMESKEERNSEYLFISLLSTSLEASRRSKSAGCTPRAAAILTMLSKEGFECPDSIFPIIPFELSACMASCACVQPFSSR